MTISEPYDVTLLGGDLVQVAVVSDLASPTIFWFVDGVYHSRTTALHQTFLIDAEARIDAVDTDDPDAFDVEASAPDGYPPRRTLWWTRSTDDGVAFYRVKQQRAGGGYETVAEVPALAEAWSYRALTPRLDDLTAYDWLIVPVDDAGNEGTSLALELETVVRTPDGVDFSVAFDNGTQRVTVSEAV